MRWRSFVFQNPIVYVMITSERLLKLISTVFNDKLTLFYCFDSDRKSKDPDNSCCNCCYIYGFKSRCMRTRLQSELVNCSGDLQTL